MNIKIFMCCHNGFSVIPPLCVPIQCGAALNPRIKRTIPDNTGDNISDKNRQYCELTAHYYAWKNVDADYYGFCHYRRFFCFGNSKKPYLVRGKLSENDKLLGTAEQIENLAKNFDIIIPKSEDMGLSVREHYSSAKYHYAADLELFIKLLKEKYPDISEAADQYLKQNKQFFCNMFIMKKDLFFKYCEMLFDVLGEFDTLKTPYESFQSNRADGYLGEIFTGIFVSFKRSTDAMVKEIQRLDIGLSPAKTIGYFLFPPESKIRFNMKRFIKSIRKDF